MHHWNIGIFKQDIAQELVDDQKIGILVDFG